MDPITLLIVVLRTLKEIFPIESALTLGVIFFALSWIVRRPVVTLPQSGQHPSHRRSTLALYGIWAPLGILAVTAIANWITLHIQVTAVHWSTGALTRSLPLFAAAASIAILGVLLAREPRPELAARTIGPHRRWWTNLPIAPGIAAGITAAILGCVALWQSAIGVVPPAGANRYGIGTLTEDTPTYQQMQGGLGYFDGAGWLNHGTTLLALAAAFLAVAIVLGRDARRAVSRTASPSQTLAERRSTARLVGLVALGGLLLTTGVVLAHVGFTGSIIVSATGMSAPGEAGDTFYAGSDYRAVAELMHRGGYLVQGAGAALLLRIVADTIRVRRAAGARFRRDADDSETTLAAPETTEVTA
ncbi:hypothetical protein JD292_01665 [Leucobacter sp. CSA2]|uniref:Uncharacterized protein n=1 Tax=Leucobacter edaphi TaxID=2796472 RepID=A0A934QBG7_9MICO|nr:hypothetical protein [Leucobacter edaphi]MBK0420790.1 hypothetical protein [Leucobacter edaphi]